MKPAAERLYELLPAIHRLRDAAEGEPLKALIAVIAEQVTVIEDDLAQLYDDQFIETCAPWVAPYLGDLIGYRPLHGVVPRVRSSRAEIANTIGYRRRKGTAAMLEQLARDVTGWPARVVECFQRLATTQHLNHVRLGNRLPDLRAWEPLERIDTPFDSLAHTADVRRIALGRGRYNLPNIAIFLWRIASQRLRDVEPFRCDDRRFQFNPLGIDAPLFTRPEAREDFTGLATRRHVPEPIGRRIAATYLDDYYGEEKSFFVRVAGRAVLREEVVIRDLSGGPIGTWANLPELGVAIDPVLGRLAFGSAEPAPGAVEVTFHHGFSSELGGGDYDRSAEVPVEFLAPTVWQRGVSARREPVAGSLVPNLAEAVLAWNEQLPGTTGVIALLDSATFPGDVTITLPSGSRLLIVAAEWPEVLTPSGRRRVPGRFEARGCRPHLRGTIAVQSDGGTDAPAGQLVLNGLLLEGALSVEGPAAEISLRHCTLVPGRALTPEGWPVAPREPSVLVLAEQAQVHVDHSIVGGIRTTTGASTQITNSVVDATSRCGVAFSAPDAHGPGGALRVENSTVIGKVHTRLLELASNTIFHARQAVFDAWPAPVISERRQAGCVRFCYVPPHSRTPRRYRCQPADEAEAARVSPPFTSLRFGEPGYGQLSPRLVPEIFCGADDESQMGVFHELFEPQRITNLNVRLDEYLRFGLEAGLFFEPRLVGRLPKPNPYNYAPWVDLCGDGVSAPLPGVGTGLI